MVADKTQIQERLNSLRTQYTREYPSRMEKLKAAWEACIVQGMSCECLTTVQRLTHNIKGSGATFGYPKVSELADILYAMLSEALKPSAEMNDIRTQEISTLIDQLANLELVSPASPPVMENGERSSLEVESKYKSVKQYILLVEDDELLAEEISLQLNHFGYEIVVIHNTEEIDSIIKDRMPNAIVMDIMFPGSDLGGIEAIEKLKKSVLHMPPVLFLSGRTDIKSRIKAASAGGSAYLTKPVNIAELVDQLDIVTRSREEEPYRVLIVDDTRCLAQYFSMTLESADMVTRMVTDPMNVIDEVSDFNPELILMDMYMPGCDGIEMAKVLRQIDTYVSTPIVFLSSEKDTNKQLQAMSEGGDDFLTKPIEPDHLVAAVKARAVRYRKLRSLMVRDSLTGLYNHTKTKEMLDTEISRAERSEGCMIFAMLDIDNFKTVNDTHGHLAGDRVIKSLARLLKQRLRKTDIAGRYGGEEFAVILPETSLENAERLMNEIRENFFQILQKSDTGEFTCSFSCGIAAFPDFTDAKSLNEAADRALYVAKENGRNQVRLAGS